MKQYGTTQKLRNMSAHNYFEKDLSLFFQRLKRECPVYSI